MTTLFFARTGSHQNRSNDGQPIAISAVVRTLSSHQSIYSAGPPYINKDETPSEWSPYTLSVVEIEDKETCTEFPKAGFYWFVGLQPAECLAILGLPEQSS